MVQDLLQLWLHTLPVILVGSVAGSLLKPLLARWRGLASLARLLGLPLSCGLPVALAFVDRVASRSLLAQLFRDGLIGEGHVLRTLVFSSVATGLYFLFFYLAPLALTSLGGVWGGRFILLYLGSQILLLALAYLMPARGGEGGERGTVGEGELPPFSWEKGFREGWKGFWAASKWFLPLSALSLLFFSSNIPWHRLEALAGLSPAQVSLLAMGVVSSVGAFGVAAPMLAAHLLDGQAVLAALFLGMALHTVYEGFYQGLPLLAGLFSPRYGWRLFWLTTLLKVFSLLPAIAYSFFS